MEYKKGTLWDLKMSKTGVNHIVEVLGTFLDPGVICCLHLPPHPTEINLASPLAEHAERELIGGLNQSKPSGDFSGHFGFNVFSKFQESLRGILKPIS